MKSYEIGRKTELWMVVFLTSVIAVFWSYGAIAQPAWNPQRYMELVLTANEKYAESESHPAESPEQVQLLLESTQLRNESVDMLRAALLRGDLDRYGEDVLMQARSDLYFGYARLVEDYSLLLMCNEAEVNLEHSVTDGAIMPIEHSTAVLEWRSMLESCRERSAPVASQAEEVTPEEVAIESTVEEEPEDRQIVEVDPTVEALEDTNPLPWILIGSGAALVVGGLVNDLSMGGKVDEFEQLRDECNLQICDREQLVELRDSVETRQLITLSLVGLGLVTSAVGVVLLLTADDDTTEAGDQLSLAPLLGFDVVGISLSGWF